MVMMGMGKWDGCHGEERRLGCSIFFIIRGYLGILKIISAEVNMVEHTRVKRNFKNKEGECVISTDLKRGQYNLHYLF